MRRQQHYAPVCEDGTCHSGTLFVILRIADHRRDVLCAINTKAARQDDQVVSRATA